MPLPPSIKKTRDSLKKRMPLIKLIVGLVLIAVLLKSVDLKELAGVFRSARLLPALGCICLAWFAYGYQSFLVKLASSPFARIPLIKLFSFTMIGRFFSLFLPSYVGGDLVTGIYLTRYFRSSARAFAAIIVQRFIGGMATLFASLIGCLICFPGKIAFRILPVLLACGLAGIILLGLAFYYRKRLFRIYRSQREKHAGSRIIKMIFSLTSSIFAYRHNKLTLLKLCLASAFPVIWSTCIYFVAAYTLNISLSFTQAFLAGSATMLAVLLPLTPGGVGVGEGTFVLVAGLTGTGRADALAIALFVRFTTYVSSLPGGIIYLFTKANAPEDSAGSAGKEETGNGSGG